MIWCKKSANTTSTTSLKPEGPRIPGESVLNNNEPTTHFTGSLGARRIRRWEEQNNLLPENPLSYDYIEMVIQENWPSHNFHHVIVNRFNLVGQY